MLHLRGDAASDTPGLSALLPSDDGVGDEDVGCDVRLKEATTTLMDSFNCLTPFSLIVNSHLICICLIVYSFILKSTARKVDFLRLQDQIKCSSAGQFK